MLKRKIGDLVQINPYYDTTGTIVDTRLQTTDDYFNKNFDYKVKWNQKMEMGCGEFEFFSEKELDAAKKNWDLVKRSPQKK